MDDPERSEVPEVPEVPELSEPVVIKKRGRPKGSLNKKTIEKITVEKESSPVEPPNLVLDVDFTSDEVLGYTDTPRTPKRKPKKPKVPPPPIESEEDESPPPPPPPKPKREKENPVSRLSRSILRAILRYLRGGSRNSEQNSTRIRWHSMIVFSSGKVNAKT